MAEDSDNMDVLFICDGQACFGRDLMGCYTHGGPCSYTTDVTHSLKKRLGNDFPNTRFVVQNGGLVEQISMSGTHDCWNHES